MTKSMIAELKERLRGLPPASLKDRKPFHVHPTKSIIYNGYVPESTTDRF
jgi:hypothetical protein